MKYNYRRFIILSLVALFSINLSLYSQNVIISDDNAYTAHSSAMLDVKSLNKGLLIPRLTQDQRDAIVGPADGLLIYQTDNITGIYIYEGGWKLLGGDLGFHTATQNLILNDNWLSNDGDNEGIAIDGSGNVGIGISTPAANLHIAGDGRIRLDQNSSYVWDINAGAGGFGVEEVSPNAGTRLLIDNTGNVGIGTSSPNFNLEVEGSISANAYYGVESNDYIEIDDAENFKFFANNAERMRLTGSGFLGIGLSSPAYMLDVNGSITSRSANGFRLRKATYSAFLRNDGNDFFILLTDADNPDGGFNTLRPFRIWLDEGHVSLGNHALFVQHGGNVGIGTTNPTSKLEIAGGNIDINDNTLYIRNNENNTYGIGYDVEGGQHLTIFSDGFIDFTESDNHGNIMRIDANAGKVGIGTLNPTAKLSVQATAATGDTLFAVKDQSGRNVFVVYPDAVQVIVPTDSKDSKSTKRGAFIVSGRGTTKGSETNFMDMTKENYLIGHNVAPNVTGVKNTILGFEAANSLTTGIENVMIGYQAGELGLAGSYNVFIGNKSGYRTTESTAKRNVFIGYWAGSGNTSGYNNTFIGGWSGLSNSSGHGNTYLGAYAGSINSTGHYNICIGYNAGANFVGSNKLYIDNSSTSTPLIYGDFSSNTLNINGEFAVNNSNPSYSFDLVSKTAASSSSITYAGRFYHQYNSNYARGVIIRAGNTSGSYSGSVYFIRCADYDGTYVGNIYSSNGTLQIAAKAPTKSKGLTQKSTKNALDIIKNLQVVDYKFDTKNEYYQTGFIAEDAQQYFPEMVNYDEAENEYSIAYSTLVPLLTKALQEQQAKMEAKDNEIDNLKSRLEAIEQFIQHKTK